MLKQRRSLLVAWWDLLPARSKGDFLLSLGLSFFEVHTTMVNRLLMLIECGGRRWEDDIVMEWMLMWSAVEI